MQEQLQAMARKRMAPMPCGFHSGMAGMPAMQEQLPAMARLGEYSFDQVLLSQSRSRNECVAPRYRSWFDGLTTNGGR
jgi:hypothetical protein